MDRSVHSSSVANFFARFCIGLNKKKSDFTCSSVDVYPISVSTLAQDKTTISYYAFDILKNNPIKLELAYLVNQLYKELLSTSTKEAFKKICTKAGLKNGLQEPINHFLSKSI